MSGNDRNRGARQVGIRRVSLLASAALLTAACSSAAGAQPSIPAASTWQQVLNAAHGQTVSLWMWGGDTAGNAYVDRVLAPAAAKLGVTLRRVPITDTKDALNRILAEQQAGRHDGSVDLVWVNGDNYVTGRQAAAWLCGWAQNLPNAKYLNPADPLLTSDFGTPVAGCEAPWNKAQFALAYDSARVANPPRTINELLTWITKHPGRFTYPAPPDFTGSVFVREVFYAVSGGYRNVPLAFDQASYDKLTPRLWSTLNRLRPSLWRGGQTYPNDSSQLDALFAGGQIDLTMTYGPATLTSLVAKGTFPTTTRVLNVNEGTVGNASFLAIPVTSGHQAGAEVVANLAMSPEQQLAKANPAVWGQFSVLDPPRLPAAVNAAFAALPQSPVVPPYAMLSRNANPELSSSWVTALDNGWRRQVSAGAG
jgi:putative spermidine/putrescine transport system substrate-binding protein